MADFCNQALNCFMRHLASKNIGIAMHASQSRDSESVGAVENVWDCSPKSNRWSVENISTRVADIDGPRVDSCMQAKRI
jgi:hypothetical protein